MFKKEEFLKEHQYLNEKEVSRSDFPPDFVFGVATSAYQVGAPLSVFLLIGGKFWSGLFDSFDCVDDIIVVKDGDWLIHCLFWLFDFIFWMIVLCSYSS